MNPVQAFLSLLAPLAVVAIAVWLLVGQVPDGNERDLLNQLLGCLVMLAKDVYGFEFGSSRGSRDKDRFNCQPPSSGGEDQNHE